MKLKLPEGVWTQIQKDQKKYGMTRSNVLRMAIVEFYAKRKNENEMLQAN